MGDSIIQECPHITHTERLNYKKSRLCGTVNSNSREVSQEACQQLRIPELEDGTKPMWVISFQFYLIRAWCWEFVGVLYLFKNSFLHNLQRKHCVWKQITCECWKRHAILPNLSFLINWILAKSFSRSKF